MIRSVLIPLDGSRVSEAALPFGAWIASGLEAELLLLTVVTELGRASQSSAEEAEHQAAAAYLEGLASGLRSPGLGVRTAVRTGKAGDVILEAASAETVSLAVLTTFGKGGDPRHLGGTAGRLSRSIRKPALFVSPALSAQAPVRGPMLVGLDGSEAAEATLEPAVRLADVLKMPVTLVRVAPWASDLFAAFVGLAPPGADEEIELGSNTYLANLTERLPADDGIGYQTLRGHPAQALIDNARAAGGMLALGAHGHAAGHFWDLGGTTDKVLRGSPVPVLVVPQAAAGDGHALAAETEADTTAAGKGANGNGD